MSNSPELIEKIRFMYLHEGKTFKKIGEELGITLNKVAGIVRRNIGHNRKGLVSAKGHGRKGSWKFKATMDAMFEPVPVIRRATTVPEPASRRLSVLDLQYGECKWMDDDLKACGAPAVDTRPYCEHHMQRAYVIRKSSIKRGWR